MRARHVAHGLSNFPVYSSAFLSPYELVLGGGGGTTKSGIKNKLVRTFNIVLRLYGPDSDSVLLDCYVIEALRPG